MGWAGKRMGYRRVSVRKGGLAASLGHNMLEKRHLLYQSHDAPHGWAERWPLARIRSRWLHVPQPGGPLMAAGMLRCMPGQHDVRSSDDGTDVEFGLRDTT
ncbi:hypothetical protein J3459_010026 [Metarhizium acridum]|nr:hypothetical protein J3459_010026 [Metarhizium acridum]